MTKNQVKIAVIGDIHDKWEEEDGLALKSLGVDLVLFVGDFGNESLEIVRLIASLDLPKAVIMGNHDAWFTASVWGRRRSPYKHSKEDRVQQQLDLLGDTHVGYGKLDFPQFNLSVVGSRPFSWGGEEWKNKAFLRDRFQVYNFAQSRDLIMEAANQAAYDTIIFLGHNGPKGLGDRPEDICGRDWEPMEGDHGDLDFMEAIARVRATGKHIPLVTFGHMHHNLRHTKSRLRTMVEQREGTIYFNAARVPRIRKINSRIQRHFSLVTLSKERVEQISLLWVDENFQVASSETLYQQEEPIPSAIELS